MRIDVLHIDDHILDKIEMKHGVTFDEVDEAVFSTFRRVRRTRSKAMKVYGQTAAGRYLVVILAPHPADLWAVMTARDMVPHERREYAKKRKPGR